MERKATYENKREALKTGNVLYIAEIEDILNLIISGQQPDRKEFSDLECSVHDSVKSKLNVAFPVSEKTERKADPEEKKYILKNYKDNTFSKDEIEDVLDLIAAEKWPDMNFSDNECCLWSLICTALKIRF